ncbi:MAG: helix-turn-helix domain-containing protein [Actinomycetota bacterium]|nr:helix-turn-helix domain-containing protein [Actinomycetota bacterium]
MKTIQEYRKEAGLTQFELAVKLEVMPSTISNWERGLTEPRIGQLRAMARLFGVPSDDIELLEPSEDVRKRRRKRGSATA